MTARSALLRTLAGVGTGAAALGATYLYGSPLQFFAGDRPQVVVSSLCSASRFVVHTADTSRSARGLLTIPADGGEILFPACDHTIRALGESSPWWKPLAWLPRPFVCARMMEHGARLKEDDGLPSSTIFVGPGGPLPGVGHDRFTTIGIDLPRAEYDTLLAEFEQAE